MKIFLFFCSVLAGCNVAAQLLPSKVTGIVASADDLHPVPGVTVTIKGTNFGTVTDESGRFSLTVHDSAVLHFSHLSFEPHYVTLPSSTSSSVQVVILLMPAKAHVLDTVIASQSNQNTFARDFTNLRINDSLRKTAAANLSKSKRDMLLASIPANGTEVFTLRERGLFEKQREKMQTQHIKIFDVVRWYQFFKNRRKKR